MSKFAVPGLRQARRFAAVVVVLVLQAGCGSSGGVDAGRTDAGGDGAAEARADTPGRDGELDVPGADGSDVRNDLTDAPADATDAPTGTDGPAGCGLTDGVWSVLPNSAWDFGYGSMWSVAPLTFLYFGDDGYLRRWNGSLSTAVPIQPPPDPFLSGSPMGSGENDIWLRGTGPWVRTGVADRLDVDVAHWDGVSWKDLTLVIPVSPAIQSPNGPSTYRGAQAFWPVGPDEAWQWVSYYYDGAPAVSPNVPYHLEGGVWKAVPSPLDTLSGDPRTMWGAAKNDLWVGGAVNRQVPPTGDASAPTTAQDPLMLHWDGSTWTRVDLPIAAGNGSRAVASIWGTAANDVWAVGQTDASADTWHFDGNAWTEVPVVGPKFFLKVWGTCAGDYWAVGGNSTSSAADSQLWHYDGRAWSQVQQPQGMHVNGIITGTGPDDVWVTAARDLTCTPYEQGPYYLAMHWGRNRCGDGVIAGGETCDPPRTSGDGLRCDSSCQRPRCGNGVTDPGEDCDPPNQGDGLQCDETCHRPTCGNGVVDAGEQCDPPKYGVCDRQCQNVAPVCGDGITETGEACDFPDPKHGLCKANCTWACFNDCELGHPSTSHGSCNRYSCASFSGLVADRCWAVLGCMMGSYCVYQPPLNEPLSVTCFTGSSAPCLAPARALLASVQPDLDTSDPAVLDREAYGPGLLNLIANEAASALQAPTTGCNQMCAFSP